MRKNELFTVLFKINRFFLLRIRIRTKVVRIRYICSSCIFGKITQVLLLSINTVKNCNFYQQFVYYLSLIFHRDNNDFHRFKQFAPPKKWRKKTLLKCLPVSGVLYRPPLTNRIFFAPPGGINLFAWDLFLSGFNSKF